MSTRLRSLLFLLPIVALLAVPGAALAAKTRTRVEPGSTWISVELPSRGAWQIEIATAINGRSRTPVSISANDRAAHASLNYGVHGRWTKDGTIVAKFPGLGRVNLRFDQAEVKKEADHAEPGCTVGRETLVRKGTFRGRIKLDDRKGFGRVNLGEAPGTIFDFPAETCPVHKHGASKHGASNGAEEEPGQSAGALAGSFYSGRKLDGGELSFDVETFPSGLFGEMRAPQFEFIADFFKIRHGLSSYATVTAPLVTKGFDVTAAGEATVTPPAPFRGSATFKLESPDTASWTGDLRVPIPTLGTVALTGPEFQTVLCGSGGCTETAPGSHVEVSFGGTFTGNFFGE
jgi:hypothetical protein